jgi:hypothetical protein
MAELSLNKVSIDGFRGLRNLSLDDLGPLNILVGENNCGKTSVLEAFSILCNPRHPYEWLAMVRRRDFGGLDETRVQSLRWCFRQIGQLLDPEFMFDGHCEMTCMGKFPLRKLTVEYRDIVGEPSPKEVARISRSRRGSKASLELEEEWRGAEITHYAEFDPEASNGDFAQSGTISMNEPIVIQLWEEDPMVGRPYRPQRKGNLATDTLTPYSYQLNRLQVRSHSFASLAASKEGRHNVIELITEFDSDILDIDVLSLRGRDPAIYLRHKKLGPAPLSIFGDALRRAVLLASTLHMLKGGGILLIDELETGIHVSALERVFAWLASAAQRLNVQVIATTHSLEAVDAIAQSMTDRIDDLVTFHLKQTERETIARRIPGELLLRLRCESGLDVR